MRELNRFQQLRPAQKISDEEKRQVGLPLYPDGNLSDFAMSLRNATSRTAQDAVIGRYAEVNKELTSINMMNPLIVTFYYWFSYKARPIKLEDFRDFIEKLKHVGQPNLDNEWRYYADQLILAIDRNVLNVNYCIDFQLPIRIFYVLRLCVHVNQQGDFELKPNVTAELINRILVMPILLPAGILLGRCVDDCKLPNRMEIPKASDVMSRRGIDPCICKCDEMCQSPSDFCICIRPYIGDLFVIREELARFEAGDIADIENILAGENKTRKHRTLMHSEISTETENEMVTSEERDHQVNEKSTLQSEVKSTVDEKINVDAGVTSNLKYGESITVTPHANVVTNSSKTESGSTARSYAKDLVDRAVAKVQEKVRKVEISKVINEVEEKNRHSIDNTQPGAEHRAGIYYWVNKVSHAQVFNYGRHMMFDIIVPEPAATFQKLYALKLQSTKAATSPSKPNVTPDGIDRNTYGTLLAKYGIATTDGIQPPDSEASTQVAFSQNVPGPENNKTAAFSSNEFKAEVPKGYKATSMTWDVRCSTGHPGSTGGYDQVAVSVNVGDICLMSKTLNEWSAEKAGESIPLPNADWSSGGTANMRGEEGTLTVAVAGFSSLALELSGTVSIKCSLTDEAYRKWQGQIYNLIMADYNRKLDAYNASENKGDQLFQIKGRNPFLNREIERNEFKRSIIAILMCNYFNGIGSMMEKVAPCGYPEINFNNLGKDAPAIQFFEQVFEWEYMTYVFYHSMWARKCKWPDLIDADSGDPLFDKFLMSGAARVQVPIRPGLENVFSWFLKTGQLWGASGEPPIPGDDDYVSMIQELKEANQGNYDDRPGFIEASKGSNILTLTGSTYYWDLINNGQNNLNIQNDTDREILVNYRVYRIVKIEQANAGDNSIWKITIDRPFPEASATNMKHGVGAVFVGAPWEVIVPTELVYLQNPKDKLPVYPLS